MADENYYPVSVGDYRAQYIAVMKNLEIQLKAAGADWNDVVFRRIFVLDVEEFKSKTECTIRLDKHSDIMVDFGIMKVEIKRKCEEKNE